MGPLESSEHSEFLARHVYWLVKRELDSVGADNDRSRGRQIELANRLIQFLIDEDGGVHDRSDCVSESGKLVLEAMEPNPALGEVVPFPRPHIPLRRTSLLVNGRRDVQMASAIQHEIPSADRIDLICAFVLHSGVRLFQDQLKARIERGAICRVITSVYTGSTERRALDLLVKLGATVKISYETDRTRLHAKAWLFHRNGGLHTAYVGSSNLTHWAQIDGLEWNVRASAADSPEIIKRFAATFDQYWEEPEFEDYLPDRDGDRLEAALSAAGKRKRGSGPESHLPLLVSVSPKPHQVMALEALQAERDHGHNRNLVVAATGTGKTWIAAFDFKRLYRDRTVRSLLFVAHRQEILEQSRAVFQLVLGEPAFGELLVAGQRPSEGRFVFASVQSLRNQIEELDAETYDAVIVDEFHHAAADSYRRLLTHLKPRILLGLTATPERADGQSVLDWFDDRIAWESRLWDALDHGLLCPFHYFGINDGTDLSTIGFKRGRYVTSELENVLTGNDMRAKLIFEAVRKYVAGPGQMRALGFCAGVRHARFMAQKFTSFGCKSIALDAETPGPERRAARSKLRNGEIQAIFTVDLFNEGVDIPEVDTLLMLRPTESATVFLQQLGRGLRWAAGKRVLTVLDFVSQSSKEYRYDIRYRAMLGGTRKQVRTAIEQDFPMLPPGCALRLDPIAKTTVLANLKSAVLTRRARLAEDLKALGAGTGIQSFLDQAGFELEDIYARPSSSNCFTELQRLAGLAANDPNARTKAIERAFGRMLYVDDQERIRNWRQLVGGEASAKSSPASEREKRVELMLFALLASRGTPAIEAPQVFDLVRNNSDLRFEMLELLDILDDGIRNVPKPALPGTDVPLASHASYSLAEIMAAFGIKDKKGAVLLPQAGVFWDPASRTDLLFVTLEKSENDYSPTTRYDDFPISPSLFHWESQNSTRADSETGNRYINHKDQDSSVLLFVRERKKDSRGETMPYTCLGRAFYCSHESERPMRIVWRLEREMPGGLYQSGKVVAG